MFILFCEYRCCYFMERFVVWNEVWLFLFGVLLFDALLFGALLFGALVILRFFY